ncbi:hypothetical protein GIB67_039703 [Kingdonia uniflora]|uniref:Uncharacterized protein n=1 Tax=Kingdonia uniflora TaxID=39325 RepID=A0A7J7MQA2_9MAGN|nr:hypothetical protein GIB67_039703 [Kingdonia uniflora]
MVEQSRVLNIPGAEKQTKRELFDSLRQELEYPVLEKASKSAWDLILDSDELGKEISDTVERVFYRLSGQEPPPNNEAQPENETLDSARKRSFNQMSEVADRSGDPPS